MGASPSSVVAVLESSHASRHQFLSKRSTDRSHPLEQLKPCEYILRF